jgi:hypothetical protein
MYDEQAAPSASLAATLASVWHSHSGLVLSSDMVNQSRPSSSFLPHGVLPHVSASSSSRAATSWGSRQQRTRALRPATGQQIPEVNMRGYDSFEQLLNPEWFVPAELQTSPRPPEHSQDDLMEKSKEDPIVPKRAPSKKSPAWNSNFTHSGALNGKTWAPPLTARLPSRPVTSSSPRGSRVALAAKLSEAHSELVEKQVASAFHRISDDWKVALMAGGRSTQVRGEVELDHGRTERALKQFQVSPGRKDSNAHSHQFTQRDTEAAADRFEDLAPLEPGVYTRGFAPPPTRRLNRKMLPLHQLQEDVLAHDNELYQQPLQIQESLVEVEACQRQTKKDDRKPVFTGYVRPRVKTNGNKATWAAFKNGPIQNPLLEDSEEMEEKKKYDAWRMRVVECARTLQLQVSKFQIDLVDR